MNMALILLVMCVFLVQVSGTQSQTKPTACTERLRSIPGHTACLPPSPQLQSSGISEQDKKIIVSEHNRFRGMVAPPASNMLKMYWDMELALIAQSWASNCQIEHEESKKRNIPWVYQVGENIAWGFPSWPPVIQAWYNEKKDFKYGVSGGDVAAQIGHYTQLVWADSTRVGCGFANCYSNNTRFYVCNYAPAGNRGGYSNPYQNGITGADCGKKDGNLCDCGGKTCENGGTMNRTTCTCKCIVENLYIGEVCKLDCEDAEKEDMFYCNDPNNSYVAENCDKIADVPDRCPRMCGKCPYGDYRYDFNASIFETPTTSPEVTTLTTTVTTKRPRRVCKDKFMIQRDHSACLQPSEKLKQNTELHVKEKNHSVLYNNVETVGSQIISENGAEYLNVIGISTAEIDLIVAEHNKYRANVEPPATNMLALSWDPEIAMIAQVWAEACNMKSDEQTHRTIPGRYDLGQNIAVGVYNWTEAIGLWNASGEVFVYGKYQTDVATYTQLMWASTSKVGCGYAECTDGKFFVCNYGPSGNTRQDNSEPYVKGARCSACNGTCRDNLCDCGTRSCENGGIMDPATCTCSCKTEFYQHPNCSLSCGDVKEPALCYKTAFKDGCADNSLVRTFCPDMCKVCPYADPTYREHGVTPPPPLTTTPKRIPANGHDQVGGVERVRGGPMVVGLLVLTTFYL